MSRNSKFTVHGIITFFGEVDFVEGKSRKFGSDTKLMWDGGRFRVCGGNFVELRKDKRRKERYDCGSQPDLGITAYD